MNNQKHDTSQLASTRDGRGTTRLVLAAIQGFFARIRLFGLAGRTLFAALLKALLAMLLGIGFIELAHQFWPPMQELLAIVGEVLLLYGGLLLLIGCTRAWRLVFRVMIATNDIRHIR